jgi:hypothetical protein
MANFINVPLPEKGGDPRKLWQTVAELIKALNDLSVTIITSDGSKQASITDGDIEIDLTNLLAYSDGQDLIPNFGGEGSEQQSGGTDLQTGAQSGGQGN